MMATSAWSDTARLRNKPASLPAHVSEKLPSGSTQTERLPITEAATGETQGPQTQTAPPIEETVRKRKSERQSPTQEGKAASKKRSVKLSPERMRIVLGRPQGNIPSYPSQPAKPGFAPKHSRVGSSAARRATKATTSSGGASNGDFTTTAKQQSTRHTTPSSWSCGKLQEVFGTRPIRFS